ncbi:RE1, partial [Symbiodinium sp. KB8]
GMSASPSAGTTVTSRFSDASKVVRMPDPFGSAESDTDLSKWNEFNMSFRAWITYAEPSFETDLNAAEAKGDVVFEFATLTDTQKQRSNQLYSLYSILTGLLKHRPLIVLRGVSERNGLEVWRQLSQIYTPRNKSRSLAILTTLMQYPPFTKDKTLREQVATLDRLAQEYSRVAGQEPSDDILLGTLMRVLPSQIRAHLQVQLKEDSTYNDLRSKVLAYEIVSSTWSSQRVSIELGLNTTSASSSQGHDPMEVDRIKGDLKGDKGKGKHGWGKPGGKKGDAYKGKGQGSKGKGKGYQKGKGYGGWSDSKAGKSGKGGWQSQRYDAKAKGKGKKGQISQVQPGECLYCHRQGHWKRDCREYQRDLAAGRVRAVEWNDGEARAAETLSTAASTQSHGASTTAPSTQTSSARMASSQAAPNNHVIRQVAQVPVYDMTCSDDVFDLTIFDIADDTADSSQPFRVFAVQQTETITSRAPRCSAELGMESHALHGVTQGPQKKCEWFDMTVTDGDSEWTTPDTIILDSGADHSVLPETYSMVGHSMYEHSSFNGCVDAQGNPLETVDVRSSIIALGGDVRFRESFLISKVTSPLLCLGKILRSGWEIRWLQEYGGKPQLALVNGDRSVPLGFRRNSLCVEGSILLGADGVPRGEDLRDQCREPQLEVYVRAISLGASLNALATQSSRTWTALDYEGKISGWCGPSQCFRDSTVIPGAHELLWRRTTLVRRSGEWEIIEFGEDISALEDREKKLPDPKTVELCLTLAHDYHLSPEELGFDVSFPSTLPVGSHVPEPVDVEESPDLSGGADHGEAQAHAGLDEDEDPPSERVVPLEDQEIEVDGTRLTVASEIEALREACKLFGLSSRGRKEQLFGRLRKRIADQHVIIKHDAKASVSAELERKPHVINTPNTPTKEEVAEHAITHLPYKSWCAECVKHKVRDDRHSGDLSHTSSEHPVIQFDFGFSRRDETSEDKAIFLVIKDRTTKSISAVPTLSKGQQYMSYMTTEAVRFISWLGHRKVVLQGDNEPSLVAIVGHVKKACLEAVRAQAGTLVTYLEKQGGAEEGKIIFGVFHPIYSWAVIHACFLINRFAVNHGLTAFERTTGAQYSGKLATFGECVLGHVHTSAKAGPRWIRGVWLGKSVLNDTHLLACSQGLMVTRSLRRLPNAWSLDDAGEVKVSPWDHGFANLSGKLMVPRRSVKPKAVALPAPEVPGALPEVVPSAAPTAGEEAGSDPSSSSRSSSGGGTHSRDMSLDGSQLTDVMQDETLGHGGASQPSTINRVLEGIDRCSVCSVGAEKLSHEDEELQVTWDEQALDGLEQYDLDYDQGSTKESDWDLEVTDKEIEAQLAEYDMLADRVEIARLRFVRTWRAKMREGRKVWIRRSRYVAREFAWAEDRTDLFAPASSAVANRIIPVIYVQKMAEDPSCGWVLWVMDITDAYLSVVQKVPTIVSLEIGGRVEEYALGRVLPGQRDGASCWYHSVTEYMNKDLSVEVFQSHPSLLRISNQCAMQMHVDDFLGCSPRSFLDERFRPVMESKYKISVEVLEPGSEISFLKRRHILNFDGSLMLAPQASHLHKLQDLLRLHGKAPRKTPFNEVLNELDESEELSAGDATLYRMCVGLLMYLSQDVVECQNTIRSLASKMSRPTVNSMKALRQLGAYLCGASNQGVLLKAKGPSEGVLGQVYDGGGYALEAYSDSDWAASRAHRRSVSSGMVFYGGCLIHSSSRTQRLIALSSGEAEVHAATSTLIDALFIRDCISFVSGIKDIKIRLCLDASAAIGMLRRQGVGKVRHLSTRILWVQQKTASQEVEVCKVRTDVNVADLGTKSLSRDVMLRLMFLISIVNVDTGEPVGQQAYDNYIAAQAMKAAVRSLRADGIQRVPKASLQRAITMSVFAVTSALGQHTHSQDIKEISDHIEYIKEISDHIEDITEINYHIEDITEINYHIEDITEISDHIEDIKEISDHVEDITEISDHVEDITEISDHVEDITDISYHVEGIKRIIDIAIYIIFYVFYMVVVAMLDNKYIGMFVFLCGLPRVHAQRRIDMNDVFSWVDIYIVAVLVMVFFLGRWSVTTTSSSSTRTSRSTTTSSSSSSATSSATTFSGEPEYYDDLFEALCVTPRQVRRHRRYRDNGLEYDADLIDRYESGGRRALTEKELDDDDMTTESVPVGFPSNLYFTPARGRSYHVRGCGNICNCRVELYTQEVHERLGLAPCRVCNPPVLPEEFTVRAVPQRRR